MRPKFIFALLLSTSLVCGIIFFARQSREKSSEKTVVKAPGKPANFVERQTASVAAPTSTVSISASKDAPTAPVAPKTVTDEQRQAAIEAETEHLSEWAMQNDPQSLSNILGDLTSPEKEIRTAAIEATRQFDDAAAIPILKAAAAKDDDTEEQTALLDAADFLSLPSVDLTAQNSKTPADQNNVRPRPALDAAHSQPQQTSTTQTNSD